jgi:Putative Actinobacterial Holin-X, holin superfamily III
MEHDDTGGTGPGRHDTDLFEMLSRLFGDAERLVMQQIVLLRAELAEAVGRLTTGILLMVVGVAVGCAGIGAVMLAMILLLGKLVPLWLAAAIVGLAIMAAGGGLVMFGRGLVKRAGLAPRRAYQSWRETGDWLRQELS